MSEKNNYINFQTGEIYPNAEIAIQARREIYEQEKMEVEGNKNPPFIQLTKGVSPDILAKISRENSTAIEVLMFFFKNMDDYNVIMVSQQTISEAIKSSRRTVARAIKVLEENGAIGIAKVSNANVYIINPHLAWQKAYKQRNIARMKAIVLLGKDENEKLFNRFNEVYKVSEENSLTVDNVATKIAKSKPQAQPPSKEIQPQDQELEDQELEDQELEKAQKIYEEFEQNREEDEERYY